MILDVFVGKEKPRLVQWRIRKARKERRSHWILETIFNGTQACIIGAGRLGTNSL